MCCQGAAPLAHRRLGIEGIALEEEIYGPVCRELVSLKNDVFGGLESCFQLIVSGLSARPICFVF